LVACFPLAAAHPSAAQALLPQSFAGWNAGAAQPVNLGQFSAADAAAIREYGFKTVERVEYARGAETLTVTLYRMMDPSAAYGAFTYLRPAGMPSQNISQFSAGSANRALVVVGNILIDASGAAVAKSMKDIRTLASALISKADPSPYPSIGVHLPQEARVPGSEHYFVGPVALHALIPVGSGDWLGFSNGAEAISAKFHKGGQEVTLLIVEYPTQQIASKHFDSAQPTFQSSSPAPVPGYLFLSWERDGDLISIVFGQAPSTFANTLVKKVVFGHNITWNEPSYKATELSWPTYVIGAFTGTGIIMLFSIVSGLGFGMIRIAIKVFLPGKVFDRHGKIEVIQLGLSGKPIDTKDFY
jgi:hypothetical protein